MLLENRVSKGLPVHKVMFNLEKNLVVMKFQTRHFKLGKIPNSTRVRFQVQIEMKLILFIP